jgi:hypothetical protein
VSGFRAPALLLALALLGCEDGIVLDPGGPPDVAGEYAVDFTIIATIDPIFGFEGCAGLIEAGTTAVALTVTQAGERVTLGFEDLDLPIRSDLTGPIDRDGAFLFEGDLVAGPVRIPNEAAPVQVQGNGTVGGTIEESGEIDLQFEVNAVSCRFLGSITGELG